MKLKYLFTFIILLQITTFLDAYSAGGEEENPTRNMPVSTKTPETKLLPVVETKILPGGLIERLITGPEGCNCLRMRFDSESALEIGFSNDSVGGRIASVIGKHKEMDRVLRDPEDIRIKSGEILNIRGTYETKESIFLQSSECVLAEVGFMWGQEKQCMISAIRGSSSPLLGMELIGQEKDSDGKNIALVYGSLDFKEKTLGKTIRWIKADFIPGEFSDSLVIIGIKGLRVILEDPDY